MTPLKEWLRPPRSLLLILFLLTLISVSAVAWFGWKLLEQERMVEAQRAQERLEQAADRVSATLRGALAETGERLSAWLANPPAEGKPAEGLLLILTETTLSAWPPGRLLYRPFRSPEPEAPAEIFADGEVLEFLQAQPQKAADWYRRLADSPTPEIRAGALMRLSRVLRKMGRPEESRTAYTQLASIPGVRVAGAPAELVARLALCEISAGRAAAEALQADLLRARWHLTRGQFEFYWSAVSRLTGRDAPAPPPAEPVALSEAAALFWNDRVRAETPRGQATVWVDSHPFFLVWRAIPGRRAVLITRPSSLLPTIAPPGEVFAAAVDGEGRIVAGYKDSAGRKDAASRAAVRTAAESQLPWTLYITGAPSLREAGTVARQRYLLLGTAVMVLFLIAGTYFIGRAIRREMEVSRMQSDFVSAVSHEFRSPLTSMRQLSEILALGRVPSEERRQVYYETLVSETVRLQRLVESLLNFGRMEARARQYRFEELDAATLVERVVAEFEPQIAPAGRHIELLRATGPCTIEADPEALSVALRNLVDNALKYSPDRPTVWVEWAIENRHVAIRVRDQGAGIAPSEMKAIFRKFVRGTAAAAANVKGSGVGLAMVRHIVAAHRGEITVVSQPGQGSTFTILLPAATGGAGLQPAGRFSIGPPASSVLPQPKANTPAAGPCSPNETTP